MKRRSGASVPGIASRWGCRRGGACRCGGSSAAPGAWRRVKSGRASPACHENKETKGAVRLLFFRARENVRWVSVEASGPRLGRSPAWGVCRPPAPLGCAPCAPFGTRAPANCRPVGRGSGVRQGQEGACGGQWRGPRARAGQAGINAD